jgi:hypothetical protein
MTYNRRTYVRWRNACIHLPRVTKDTLFLRSRERRRDSAFDGRGLGLKSVVNVVIVKLRKKCLL